MVSSEWLVICRGWFVLANLLINYNDDESIDYHVCLTCHFLHVGSQGDSHFMDYAMIITKI